ncbi:MAG TPA: Ig-like domain repeat protein [Steroidobacteraceae bacterium]|jgi:hypothetical protein|nr:Ig-like domain repeat protein [Steroidobacteraceae bacterium]
MKTSSSRGLVTRILGAMVVVSLLSGPTSFAVFAQTGSPPTAQPAQTPAPAPAGDAAAREAWRAAIAKVPLPKMGCFQAEYPKTEWQEVPCGRPSPYPNQTRPGAGSGAGPNNVGNLSGDFSAQTSGLISSAVGSFLPPTNANGVNGNVTQFVGASPIVDPNVNNVFMFQMNTQFFSNPPACSLAPNGAAGCSGWQQFLFSQTQGPPPTGTQQSVAPGATLGNTPGIFIEYWLLNWGTPCPTLPAWAVPPGQPPTTLWNAGQNGNCWFNSPITYVSPQSIANLANMTLTATAGANLDTVQLSSPTMLNPPAVGWPSVLNAAQFWNTAEFNIFGDCCGSETFFASPAVVAIKTSINDGTNSAPTCGTISFTAETNNASFVPTAAPVCCRYGTPSPSIEFMEAFDTAHTHNAWCTASSLVGDPHITTLDGKLYDFQGAGEFVSLRDPDGMEIQTRQTPVSTTFIGTDAHDGLTTCVSLNTAVAARVGEHRVTWEPNLSGVPDPSGLQLRIDGALTTLGPHGMALGTGGRVVPRVVPSAGSALEVDFPDGKTMLAISRFWQSQSKWYLDVDVSHLGLTTGDVGTFGRGLAGAIPDGSWLPALPNGASMGPMPASLPDRYTALYQTFADAWRVASKDSLFDYAPGTSTDTFTMRDWPKQTPPCTVPDTKPAEPASQAVAEAACQRVRDVGKHADCVFDVRVTGNLDFAETYLAGQRMLADSTTISLTDDVDPTQVGEWAIFTAFVVPYSTAATGFPSGTVQFAIDGTNAGDPVIVDAKGRAKLETSRLKVGTHRVTANYVPEAGGAYLPSTSLEKIHEVVRCPCGAAQEQK